MNSSIQWLSHTYKLTKYFLQDAYVQDVNKNNPIGTQGFVAYTYANLMKDMWFGTSGSLSPWAIKKAIARHAPQFEGYAQHDAHELLTFILDTLHEDLNRVKEKKYEELKDTNDLDDTQAS